MGNFKQCHKGSKVIFTLFDEKIGPIKIKAGGLNNDLVILDKEIAISLTSHYAPKFSFMGIEPKVIKTQKVINIDWPDMDIPDLNKQDWLDIIKEIKEQGQDVVIFCTGGHGRTGTALSILAVLLKVYKGNDPVEYIRRIYCEHAVETSEQIEYINDITGTKNTKSLKDIQVIEELLAEERRKKGISSMSGNWNDYI